jgi:iron complex outermembrane recepter protein
VTYDEQIDEDAPLRYRQRLWSAGTEAEWELPALTQLSGGVVVDGASTPESGDKPPLGALSTWGARVGVATEALEPVRLHAAVSRRARFPALRELYSGALGRFEPNPGLKPERLFGAEAGVTATRSGVELQGVLFHHRLADAIVRVPVGDNMLRRENRDGIRSTGVELLGEWQRGGLSLQGDATLQQIRVLDPSVSSGERHPEHNPEVRVGADVGVPLPLRLRGLAAVRYTGRQYCVNPDLEQTVALDAQTRVDLGMDRSWTLRGAGVLQTLRAALALDNVGDRAVYDQCGMPQPGRTLRLSLELR